MMNLHRICDRSKGGGRRRGSVLVVVLALLSALMLLGFVFYTLASQERENARYFTASQKWYSAQLSPDELMDFALEQLIVGPQDDLANSALWGGRYSLLAGLVGDDLQPFSGRGVNVVDQGQLAGGTGDGVPYVDGNANGVQDDGAAGSGSGAQRQLRLDAAEYAISLNSLPGVINLRDASAAGFEKPDVGYTYPDINSPFLSFVATEPMTGQRVVIPSFHRPQYLRGLFGGNNSDTWYTDPASMSYVLRPHAERPVRVFDYDTGEVVNAESGGSPVLRFEDGASGPFFSTPEDGEFGSASDPVEGFWDLSSVGGTAVDKYDSDPDDDGVADAVWLDLDHPVEETPDGTERFIPLFGITVYDLDGLLNVNAHGNTYGVPATLTNLPANPFDFLSKSNEGRRRYEVNPQYALLNGPAAMPTGTGLFEQHERFFGAAPATPTQLANMEWWFILAGRGELDPSLKLGQLYTGKRGEANLLSDAMKAGSAAWLNPYAHARPGLTGSDEPAGVADGSRGSTFNDVNGQVFPVAMIFPAPRQPEDHQGQGTYVQADGKTPVVFAPFASLPAGQQAALTALGRVRVPFYQNYWLPPRPGAVPFPGVTFLPYPATGPTWAYLLPGANFPTVARLVTSMALGTGLISADGRLVDDPGETMLDAETARDQVTDSIFGADEAAALHMVDQDRTNNGIVSRLLKLAPANFEKADDRLDRRRRVTTVSSDLKAYSYADPDPAGSGTGRFWEVEPVDVNFPDLPTFPPRFLGLLPGGQFNQNEPFRAEARGLLASQPNMNRFTNAQVALKQLSRKLSVNHVAAAYVGRDQQPRFYLRPLTPHPVRHPGTMQPVLGNGAVTGPGSITTFGLSDQVLHQREQQNPTVSEGFLPSTIPAIDHDGNPGTAEIPVPALQEWHARRDRQNLARDIYTLLYTFGDPSGTNLKTTAPPYTQAQLFEMAQFAVNVVDAMDPDDTITAFVFDTDFRDGYTPLDDGYSSTNPVTTLVDLDGTFDEDGPGIDGDGDNVPATNNTRYLDTTTGRGMVYGVEAQKLTFGEALALLTKKYSADGSTPEPDETGDDYGATDWDDSWQRDFTFVELQNVTAEPVRLGGGWSIVCQPNQLDGGTPLPRAVTLNDPGQQVGVGTASPTSPLPTPLPAYGTFVVGTAGDGHNTERGTPAASRPGFSGALPRPSYVFIDASAGTSGAAPAAFGDFERIAPATNLPSTEELPNFFDLIERDKSAPATFRVNDLRAAGTGFDFARDAAAVTVDPWHDEHGDDTGPKGGAWLELGGQEVRDTITSGFVTFHLRRRANLNRVTPAETYLPNQSPDAALENDNPWVIVDTIHVPLSVLDLNGADTTPDLQAKMQDIKAQQRADTLAAINANITYDAATFRANTLGAIAGGSAMNWQRHYDRAFASLADLLTVPLYSPRDVTEAFQPGAATIVRATSDPRQTAAVNILFPETDHRPLGSTLAAPQFAIGALAQTTPDPSAGNLWYRLFEFFEVPQKHGDHDGLPWFADYGGPSQWLSDPAQRQDWLREELRLREFGKLNLNTMRHPHALAGLLDDARVFWFQNDRARFAPSAGLGGLPASGTGGGVNIEKWLLNVPGFPTALARDWWISMLASRDGGYDPYSRPLGQDLILPGVPSARPFLDFGSGPSTAGAAIQRDFQRTLLRSMPADSNGMAPLDLNGIEGVSPNPVSADARRSLFELGNVGGHPATPPAPTIPLGSPILGSNAEFSTRYRLLGKVLNHATTRSNTFLAFIEVQFFNATGVDLDGDGNDDVHQIGAKREEDLPYRGVFVIDRTLALELLRRRDLPPSAGVQNPPGLWPTNSRYRTYSFAREQGPDGRPQPTFPWRDLIQYRRIIAQ